MAQSGFAPVAISLPQPPKHWDSRCVSFFAVMDLICARQALFLGPTPLSCSTWGEFCSESQGPPDSGDNTGEACGHPATERTMIMAKVLEPGAVLPREPELATPTTGEQTGKEAEAENLFYWRRQTRG